jgi:hypothetical protein
LLVNAPTHDASGTRTVSLSHRADKDRKWFYKLLKNLL